MARPQGVKNGEGKKKILVAPEKRAKNTPITKLLDQVNRCPGITTRELGALNNIDHTAVVRLFQRHGIERQQTEDYKGNRADFFAGMQEKIVASITQEDLQKASLRDKIISAGVLYDKERLERGQSTSNQSVFFRVLSEAPDLPGGE